MPEMYEISSDDLVATIEELQPTLVGKSRSLVMVAALAIAINAYEPEIDEVRLHKAIEDGVTWISLYLSPQPEQVN